MILFYLLFIVLLLSPETTHLGIKNGLILLENQVIPSLYPFILLSSYMQAHTVLNTFPLILAAMMSGYPVGAKIIANLKSSNLPLSHQELLLICNLPSPAYILSFIGFQCLNTSALGLLIYFCVFAGNLCTVLLLRLLKHLKKKKFPITSRLFSCEHSQTNIYTYSPKNKLSSSFNEVIHDSFISLGNIIVYILIFNVAASFIQTFGLISQKGKLLLIGLFEITTGISLLIEQNFSIQTTLIIITGLVSFGGLSVIAQTASMIQSSDLSIKKYMTDKTIASTIAMSVMYGITLLFN